MGMRVRRSVLLCLAATVVAILAFAGPLAVHAAADDDDDHDRARELREGGEIRALSEILAEVSRRVPGEIVAVDLVRGRDRWVYRVQVVSADGRRQIVDVDAGKGTVFDDEGGER